jgi:hypothetical protein
MEKDIDRIPKNQDTDIIIRIDDFGGKRGVTIREFVKGERYTGFTKAGTRIPADKFRIFKEAINSIDEKDLVVEESSGEEEVIEKKDSRRESKSDENSGTLSDIEEQEI